MHLRATSSQTYRKTWHGVHILSLSDTMHPEMAFQSPNPANRRRRRRTSVRSPYSVEKKGLNHSLSKSPLSPVTKLMSTFHKNTSPYKKPISTRTINRWDTKEQNRRKNAVRLALPSGTPQKNRTAAGASYQKWDWSHARTNFACNKFKLDRQRGNV